MVNSDFHIAEPLSEATETAPYRRAGSRQSVSLIVCMRVTICVSVLQQNRISRTAASTHTCTSTRAHFVTDPAPGRLWHSEQTQARDADSSGVAESDHPGPARPTIWLAGGSMRLKPRRGRRTTCPKCRHGDARCLIFGFSQAHIDYYSYRLRPGRSTVLAAVSGI